MARMNHCFAAMALAIACVPAMAQNDWQSRKDRENAATSAASITRNGGKWDAKAEADRREASRQRAEAQLLAGFTHCDREYCYGRGGVAFYRSAPDMLISPEGRACHRSGPGWVCN